MDGHGEQKACLEATAHTLFIPIFLSEDRRRIFNRAGSAGNLFDRE